MAEHTIHDVQGVFFDFNGTLARLATWETHEAVFARRGLVDAAAVWGDRWSVGPSDGEAHFEHSTSREAYRGWELERYRTRARACGVGEDQLDDLVTELDRATNTFTLELYDDVMETFATLKAHKLAIAICSNWFWDLDRAIDDVGLASAVDISVTSAQAGARKPHPQIFLEALRQCGLQTENVLYVGDTWATDIEGSRAVGMTAIHLWRPEREREEDRPPGLRPGIYRISDLRELGDFV